MKTLEYTVKDSLGIHARPAGLLVKCAKEQNSKITIEKGEKSADATKLFAVMGLGVRCGETITVKVEDGDEDASLFAVQKFLEENL